MLSYLKWTATAFMLSALMACSQSNTSGGAPQTITIDQVQADIKAACNYVPSIQSIVEVASTITTAINPVAGGAATIVVATGNAITTEVCKAVQAQTMQGKAKAKGPGGEPLKEQALDVVVNGVTVHGTWTPPEAKI